jgi:dTDP-4-dehydrorhamnose 3,5-epimerase
VRKIEDRLIGPLLLEPEIYRDERGFFLETYSRMRYAEVGIPVDFVQDNHSRSVRSTLRGLHFQVDPGQAKLVRVARGAIWDVVVDIRRTSATFGHWEAFELDDERQRQLYVPIGFAHGFCVMSDVADVSYKVSTYYDAAKERGIAWDDPSIGVEWPLREPLLSSRDRANPRLDEVFTSLPE